MSEKVVSELASLMVKPDAMLLRLKAGEENIDLELTPHMAREIAHIIADALHDLERGQILPAGELLVPANVEPARWEAAKGSLRLDEKLVLQAGSSSSTKIVLRLAPESAEQWAKEALRLIAERHAGRRQ